MTPDPDFGRIRKTVALEEPDRVPLAEATIAYAIQSRFLGREVRPDDLESQIEFWLKAGYDYVPITVGMMTPGAVTQESKISKVLRRMVLDKNPDETDEKAWNLELTSFIHERKDFEEFPWEEAAELDFSLLDRAEGLLPAGMKVVAVSGKIFTLTWMLMGFNNFAMKLVLDEQLVADVFEKVARIQLSALDQILAKDYVGGVWVVDDVAFGTGPMISPQSLRDHVFKWYQEIAARCHSQDRLLFMHSDGDLTGLMEDLIDIGLDAIHPIDPTCMDIVKVKQEFGERICLVGNVPNEMLRSATVQEIIDYTGNLLRRVAPGGGYCLGSGNSVPDWAKFENYMAMRETALRSGSYPINI